MTARREGSPPVLLLRASSARVVVQRHLAHLRGRFESAGWQVVEGDDAGPVSRSLLAIVDDPWVVPLPEQLERLGRAPGGARWRVPAVLGIDGPQGWHPRVAPGSRLEYERIAIGRSTGGSPRVMTGAWPGVAVAPAEAAEPLLRAGWPPATGEVVLIPTVRMFRYHDPAAHARLELDAFIPEGARKRVSALLRRANLPVIAPRLGVGKYLAIDGDGQEGGGRQDAPDPAAVHRRRVRDRGGSAARAAPSAGRRVIRAGRQRGTIR